MMGEQAVVDYIKHSNRKLFDRLQGLPFPSDHIPQSLHGQRLIYRSQHIAQPAYQHPDQNGYITMLDGTEGSKQVVAIIAKEGLNSVLPVDGSALENPTNSKEAIALRKRKWMDIESVLSDVDRENQKRSKMQKLDTSDSLILGGPLDMPPPSDRYKKQGLDDAARTRDYRQRRREQCQEHQRGYGTALTYRSPNNLAKLPTLICYCREPAEDQGGNLVTCSSENCLTGMFVSQLCGD